MAAQIVQSLVDSEQIEESTQGKTLAKNMSHKGDSNQHSDTQSTLRKRTGERTTVGWDQNPELLQWRANVLLDEMMLGAVDIAANESTAPTPAPIRPTRNTGAVDAYPDEPASARRTAPTTNTQPTQHPTGYANGFRREPEPPPTVGTHDELAQPRDPQDEWSRPAWHFAEPASPPPTLPPPTATPSARAVALQEHTRYHQTPPTAATERTAERSRAAGQSTPTPDMRTTAVGAPPPPRPSPSTAPKEATANPKAEQWVFAAEQRYQQIAARHGTTPPGPGVVASSTAPQGWVEATDTFFDEFAANDYGYAAGAGRSTTGRARAHQSIRRSNLLPRMSNLDPHALQQEMVMLQTELEQALPTGHESRERALHLLQKAYTILHADPSRSAEVDYYLQQVRTIGQRVQETLHWSNLYHSRLRIYLLAWTVLSVILISARYFYQQGLQVAIGGMSGAATDTESLLSYNLITIVTAFFAGALGGAVGAFINMRQYAHIKQGFFDRKYSLRGLILPLIGGLVGLVLCLFFGVIYYLFGIDPAVNWLMGALPALLAFTFGITQEFIYGTRS